MERDDRGQLRSQHAAELISGIHEARNGAGRAARNSGSDRPKRTLRKIERSGATGKHDTRDSRILRACSEHQENRGEHKPEDSDAAPTESLAIAFHKGVADRAA